MGVDEPTYYENDMKIFIDDGGRSHRRWMLRVMVSSATEAVRTARFILGDNVEINHVE